MKSLAFDVMGNIDSFRRSTDTTVWFKNFKHAYQGNQLIRITNAGRASRNNSFTYDGNDNGTKNTRLGIKQIQCNYLNLAKKFV